MAPQGPVSPCHQARNPTQLHSFATGSAASLQKARLCSHIRKCYLIHSQKRHGLAVWLTETANVTENQNKTTKSFQISRIMNYIKTTTCCIIPETTGGAQKQLQDTVLTGPEGIYSDLEKRSELSKALRKMALTQQK